MEADPNAVAMSAEEMHQSVDRARSYALLWVLMRNRILRQVNQLEDEGVLSRRPSVP
jgi:hypothetical protein